jgi:hypothetical protein
VSAVRSRKLERAGGRGLSVVETLASVRFAVLIVMLLAVACVVGTLVPQGPDAVRYVRSHPEAAVRFALLDATGLTRVYTAWWFIGLLFVLSASIATCSFKRFSSLVRTKGFARRRSLGSLMTHLSMLLILAGGIVRSTWGVRGYVELQQGEIATEFVSDDGVRPLPAAVRLNRFEVETESGGEAPRDRLLVRWPDKDVEVDLAVVLNEPQSVPAGSASGGEEFRVEVLQYEPDFVIDPETRQVGSRSTEARNPAILVAVNGPDYHNHRWLFARYPGFSTKAGDGAESGPCPLDLVFQAVPPGQPNGSGSAIKAFRSYVEFLPAGEPPVSGKVEVNGPFSYGGYTFYQSGYRPDQTDWTSLQVVRDPGVPLVYAGFILMIVGLAIIFYLNAWMTPRRSAS